MQASHRVLGNPTRKYLDLFKRALNLNHLTPRQLQNCKDENIPYVDYAILQRQNSFLAGEDAPSSIITSLNYFYKTVRANYSPSSQATMKAKMVKGRGNDWRLESAFTLLLYVLHQRGTATKGFDKHSKMLGHIWAISTKRVLQRVSRKEIKGNVQKLIALYTTGCDLSSSIPSAHDPSISHLLRLIQGELQYSFEDIENWITCVSSLSITDASLALYNSQLIPQFLINDILLRSPKSRYEVELMIQLYESSPTSVLFPITTSVIHYIKLFDIERLPEFTQLVLRKSTLNEAQLNKLIYYMSDTSLSSFDPTENKNKIYLTNIIQSERLIYENLESKNLPLSKVGVLSLALSIFPINRERSEQLFKSINSNDLTAKQEIEAYHIVSIALQPSPESVMQVIDNITHGDQMTPKIWDYFLSKMNQYGDRVINVENSKRLFKKYSRSNFLTHSQNVLHKKLESVEQILATFNGETNYFDNKSIAHVIQRLYTSSNDQSFGNVFDSPTSFARYLFSIIANPSPLIIGQFLIGESFIDPTQSFVNYLHYLKSGPTNIPSENYLKSIMIPPILNPQLKWLHPEDRSERHASQIAVHEFRKFQLQEPYPVTTNPLWRHYILLCGRMNYQDELAEILPFWESTQFTPTRKTLAMLLAALPKGNGEIIRKHALHYLLPGRADADELLGGYPWPTLMEIDYWREKMVLRTTSMAELMK